MPHLELDGARLYYETTGETGTPVLLIMGFAVPMTMWGAQVPALAERHRVIAFDNRGAGKTTARPGLYTMRGFADDAVRLLDHLGVERAHVTGVSMGGMIAQELALGHRDRVLSLSLVATQSHEPPPYLAGPTARKLANGSNGQFLLPYQAPRADFAASRAAGSAVA